MNTLYVCSKCGRTEELSKTRDSGWLIHQRIDAPQGHLIIRCPEHITGHALRLAGLPQQTDSKRIAQNLERGFYVEYGSGYTAVASEVWTDMGVQYNLTFHKDALPAFDGFTVETVPALLVEMRKIQPDLRKWRLTELD
jgi:DNA-directed RNA polymerase subunit RPC12/RpoP